MACRGKHLRLLMLALLLGLLPVQTRSANAADKILRFTNNEAGNAHPIILHADSIATWVEGNRRILTFKGHVLIATFASIAAVIVGLAESGNRADALGGLVIGLSTVATVLSWAMVNTVFAFKYARLYYFDDDGGIDFKQAEPPCYADFAYLAFTVGVAFAVSETEFTSTALRRLALPHALLSYAYTTFVIAIAVSLVPSLG